ncbi:hypothetical protein PSHT_01434, partial [Puccinia striiformis]
KYRTGGQFGAQRILYKVVNYGTGGQFGAQGSKTNLAYEEPSSSDTETEIDELDPYLLERPKKNTFSIELQTFEYYCTDGDSTKKIILLIRFHPHDPTDPLSNEDIYTMFNRQSNLRNKNKLSGCMSATLEKNKAALKEFGMPSWSDEAWKSFKNKPSPLFSNVIVTTNDFSNKPHRDKDEMIHRDSHLTPLKYLRKHTTISQIQPYYQFWDNPCYHRSLIEK